MMFHQLIFRYEDSACDPQTLVPLESWNSQRFLHVLLVWGVVLTSLLTTMSQSWGFELRYFFDRIIKKFDKEIGRGVRTTGA